MYHVSGFPMKIHFLWYSFNSACWEIFHAFCRLLIFLKSTFLTGPRSAVGNVSGNRCESDCRSRGREFDHSPVPYFHGERSFSSLPLNHSRRVVVSYKRKYVHEVLVNCLFKLAQEKVWLGELTAPP